MNNKKTVVALLLIAIIGIVGLTIAYFANSTSVENTFTTKEYGTTYEETFVSPDNWLPGDTTPKTLVATNTGSVDQAVRVLVTESWTTNNNGTLNGWIHSDGTKSNHTTQSELETDERVAVLNLANTSDWTKVGNYYYYNYKLAPTESTSSLLESVTFNPKTKLDDTCTTTTSNGVTTTTCNSSGDDYDNATYTLTLTIETVQYNKYASAWNTNVDILVMKPMNMQQFLASKTNPSNTEYNNDTKGNMFIFSHEATEHTTMLTDYRYIGNAPNNYVNFNCDNDGTNCEIWRMIGVFDVDDGTGNVEQRIKLVRGNSFATTMVWDSSAVNRWATSSLKTFLNGDYYSRSGDASEYGLKDYAKNLIHEAVYYLGVITFDSNNANVGSTEKMYVEERGNILCGSCGSDTNNLTWTGIVGLMYPSDEFMIYANGVDNKCYSDPYGCHPYGNIIGDPSTGWIYNSNMREGQIYPDSPWFITSSAATTRETCYAESGHVGYNNSSFNNAVRPVVYLSSSVKIIDGDGTSGNPYKLSL